MSKNLAGYVTAIASAQDSKPDDAAIDGQKAVVKDDGTVSVKFESNDPVVVRSLRDWLTAVLG